MPHSGVAYQLSIYIYIYIRAFGTNFVFPFKKIPPALFVNPYVIFKIVSLRVQASLAYTQHLT